MQYTVRLIDLRRENNSNTSFVVVATKETKEKEKTKKGDALTLEIQPSNQVSLVVVTCASTSITQPMVAFDELDDQWALVEAHTHDELVLRLHFNNTT